MTISIWFICGGIAFFILLIDFYWMSPFSQLRLYHVYLAIAGILAGVLGLALSIIILLVLIVLFLADIKDTVVFPFKFKKCKR